MTEQVAPGAASSDEHEATVVTEPSGKGVGDVSTTAGSTEGGAGTPSSSTDGDSKNASENSGEQSGAGQKGAAAEESARPPMRTPEQYTKNGVVYKHYTSEAQMSPIRALMEVNLSEPYNIYTFRYFINNWPALCWMASLEETGELVGAIVCKLEHERGAYRGYIAMLAVETAHRHRKIGSELVIRAIVEMKAAEADMVVLETEITNKAALGLYLRLGFLKDKRLCRYYLNGNDAFRLKLHLEPSEEKLRKAQEKMGPPPEPSAEDEKKFQEERQRLLDEASKAVR